MPRRGSERRAQAGRREGTAAAAAAWAGRAAGHRHLLPRAEAFAGPWAALPGEAALEAAAGPRCAPSSAARGGGGGAGAATRRSWVCQWRVTRGASSTRVGRRAAAAWPRSWPCPLRLRFSKGSIPRQPATGINYKAALNVSDSLNGIFHSNFVIKIERPFGCDHTGIINCICLRY